MASPAVQSQSDGETGPLVRRYPLPPSFIQLPKISPPEKTYSPTSEKSAPKSGTSNNETTSHSPRMEQSKINDTINEEKPPNKKSHPTVPSAVTKKAPTQAEQLVQPETEQSHSDSTTNGNKDGTKDQSKTIPNIGETSSDRVFEEKRTGEMDQPPAERKIVADGSASLGRGVSGKFFKGKKEEEKDVRKPTASPASSISKDSGGSEGKSSGSRLASKLSKSFYDLTSNERLKSWKSKLPSVKSNPSSSMKYKKKAETRDIPLPTTAVVPVSEPPKQPPPIFDSLPPATDPELSSVVPNSKEESAYDMAMGSYNSTTEHRSILHDNNSRRRFAALGGPPSAASRKLSENILGGSFHSSFKDSRGGIKENPPTYASSQNFHGVGGGGATGSGCLSDHPPILTNPAYSQVERGQQGVNNRNRRAGENDVFERNSFSSSKPPLFVKNQRTEAAEHQHSSTGSKKSKNFNNEDALRPTIAEQPKNIIPQRRHSDNQPPTGGSLSALNFQSAGPASEQLKLELQTEQQNRHGSEWSFEKFDPNSDRRSAKESVLRDPLIENFSDRNYSFSGGSLNKKYRHSVGVLLANALYEDSEKEEFEKFRKTELNLHNSPKIYQENMEHGTRKPQQPVTTYQSSTVPTSKNNNYEDVDNILMPPYKPPSGGYRPPPAYQAPPPPPHGRVEQNRTLDNSINISFGEEGGGGLPPPARITPFSGVRQNEDGAIVRPIAFKPVTSSKKMLSQEPSPEKSPLFTRAHPHNSSSPEHIRSSERFRAIDTESDTSNSIYGVSRPIPYASANSSKNQGRHSFSSPQKYVSDSEAMHRQKTSAAPKYLSDNEAIWQPINQTSPFMNARAKPASSGGEQSQGSTYSSPAVIRRPEPGYPSSISAENQPNSTYRKPAHQSSSSSDYDLVPEFLDFSQNLQSIQSPQSKTRRFPVSGGPVVINNSAVSNGNHNMRYSLDSGPEAKLSSDSGINSAGPISSVNTAVQQNKYRDSVNRPSSGPISGDERNSGPMNGEGRGYGTTGSHGSRQSSGIHVTPSPSDSGVAELEAALREKESELVHLRQTMEQNEEVIIKVYQEKEAKWQAKLNEWSERLVNSVNTEQRLLTQIQRLQDERANIQNSVQNLSAEKHGLQRKCKELENELFGVREQLETASKHWAICRRCGDIFMPRNNEEKSQDHKHDPTERPEDHYANTGINRLDRGSSIMSSGGPPSSYLKPPQSQSRGDSMSNKSPTPTDDLRTEIEALRGEVHGLRDSLQQQMSAFAQERSRWEKEKERVIDYQKMLQDNYVQVFQRNQDLEDRLSHSSRTSSIAPHEHHNTLNKEHSEA